MKTTIYYFSGTGNSLKIARDLSENLEECELVPIAKVWQIEGLVSTSEKVGFIFPLYFLGLPKIVHDFIDKIEFNKANYFFAVITKGGDLDCVALYQLEEILKAKSKTLNAGFIIRMPANFYRSDTESEKEQIFKEAIKEIEKISKIIKENGVTPKIEINDKKRNQWEKINYKFRKTVNINDKAFYADDTCTHCGICEQICPVNNIILVEGVPQWQHECQQCVACINFCPEKSIQYGKKISENQGYHHPEITIQDMINQKG